MIKVRFAPSPTGKLHIGNARIAFLNYLIAKKNNGQFWLRFDDTDAQRSTQEYTDGILSDLAWLGLKTDGQFKQSDNFSKYETALEKLKKSGRVYACYETSEELDIKRKLQQSQGKPPVYDRASLKLTDAEKEANGITPHWRFLLNYEAIEWDDLSRGHTRFEPGHLSDPVLVREDGRPLFTLTTVVDDGEEKISHIVRGDDHATNTAVQIQIFKALGFTAPIFGHMPLISGKNGDKMSKRLGTGAIENLRTDGIEAITLLSSLSRLGTNITADGTDTMETLLADFDMSNYGRSTPKFNVEDLVGLNAKVLHHMSYEMIKPRLPEGVNENLWNIINGNIDKIKDIEQWLDVLTGEITPIIEDADFINTAKSVLPDGEINIDTWKEWTNVIKEKTGKKGKGLFMPLRLALTGKSNGPEMGKSLPVIGREKVLNRLG